MERAIRREAVREVVAMGEVVIGLLEARDFWHRRTKSILYDDLNIASSP